MWVVTPKQHLERLADLSQPQLLDLFRTAAGVVHEMGCSSFNTMILNHGDSRNHAHLHLKVRLCWGQCAC
jgi:diadenosine tetraphosphate (Ap4A) HIT family hydrolase